MLFLLATAPLLILSFEYQGKQVFSVLRRPSNHCIAMKVANTLKVAYAPIHMSTPFLKSEVDSLRVTLLPNLDSLESIVKSDPICSGVAGPQVMKSLTPSVYNVRWLLRRVFA